jgi:hypothetical protein
VHDPHIVELALTLPQMFAAISMMATIMKRVALHSPAGRKLLLFTPPVSLTLQWAVKNLRRE